MSGGYYCTNCGCCFRTPGSGVITCGQCGHLGRKVIVARPLPPDGGDGQDEVADGAAVFEPAAFTEKEHGLGLDRAEQVHDRGGGGAAHAEVDHGDVFGGGAGHRFVAPDHLHPVPFGEEVDVAVEVGEEDVLPEGREGQTGVAGQPVFNDVGA